MHPGGCLSEKWQFYVIKMNQSKFDQSYCHESSWKDVEIWVFVPKLEIGSFGNLLFWRSLMHQIIFSSFFFFTMRSNSKWRKIFFPKGQKLSNAPRSQNFIHVVPAGASCATVGHFFLISHFFSHVKSVRHRVSFGRTLCFGLCVSSGRD